MSLFLIELGEFANLTVIGSVDPAGINPLSCLIALSASWRLSNRTKPTPLEMPAHPDSCIKKLVRLNLFLLILNGNIRVLSEPTACDYSKHLWLA